MIAARGGEAAATIGLRARSVQRRTTATNFNILWIRCPTPSTSIEENEMRF